MLIEQQCQQCKCVFRKARLQRFCTKKCGYEHRGAKPLLYECQQCKSFFNVESRQVGKGCRKFCGRACSDEASQLIKQCTNCGSEFSGKRKTCSDDCSRLMVEFHRRISHLRWNRLWTCKVFVLRNRATARARNRGNRKTWKYKCENLCSLLKRRPKPKRLRSYKVQSRAEWIWNNSCNALWLRVINRAMERKRLRAEWHSLSVWRRKLGNKRSNLIKRRRSKNERCCKRQGTDGQAKGTGASMCTERN